MITKAIQRAYDYSVKKGWDRVYWAIDIHDTMIKANYKRGEIPTEFYPHAMDVLKFLSGRITDKLILYTCSHPHEIEEYLALFQSNNIIFDFVNENPEVKTDMEGYGNYDKKPYFNILLDDKAGFQPEDWLAIKNYFKGV